MPGMVEALALQQAAQRQDGPTARVAPAHAGALQALRDERLAGGLDHARADGQVSFGGLGVVYAPAVAAEVAEHLADALAARVLGPQVDEGADDLGRAVGVVAKDVAQLVELGAAPRVVLAVGGIERGIELLGGVEEVHARLALGHEPGEEVGFVPGIDAAWEVPRVDEHESHQVLRSCDTTRLSERGFMLVESLVNSTLELQGFRVAQVTGEASGLMVTIEPDLRFSPRCGQCGAVGTYRDTRPVRRFRHVPMWGIPVELRYEPRWVICQRCRGVHVEAMPWVSGKQRMTRALMVTLATWSRVLPWRQVARLFRCAWGTVATAVEEAVACGLANRDLAELTHIGIEEVSRKRGHVYVTNVYDLERKRLIWSGEGRKESTLEAFFDYLGPERTSALEGICCDIWQPYIDVIKARAPQAVMVFDNFHIARHLMEAVDQVRGDEIGKKAPEHKALMYRARFIWLKNPCNLTEAQAFRLGELERLNLKINRAYLLKELFRHFSDYRRAGWAKKYLTKWFWWATHSQLEPMLDFGWMVR